MAAIKKGSKPDEKETQPVQSVQQPQPTQQASKPNIYSHLAPTRVPSKNHWFLHALTMILSLLILIFLVGLVILSANFSASGLFVTSYVLVAIIACIVGLVTGIIVNKLVMASKQILASSILVSVLAVIMFSIVIFIQKRLEERIDALNAAAGAGSISILGMFGPSLNPWIVGLLVLLFFNAAPYIIFMRRKKAETI